MAINQGVRQGPPTSADISPPPLPWVANPKHHLLSSFGCFRSQITKRVEPQSPEDLTRLFPPSACKPWYGSQGMWKTFFASTSPDAIARIHLLQHSERGYANERWQCYCVWNINGVITVSCWAIGLSAAAPMQPTCFISHPPLLRGEMSIVLWRAELIMAAQIQA